MQDTLKNLFAGITLSFEKRLHQGDWITFRLDPNNITTGQVLEIGWRTTKIQTLENTFSVIPNSMFATNHLVNYSTNNATFMRAIEIQAPLHTPVEEMVMLLAKAAGRVEGVAKDPPADVILGRVRFNITDFAQADVISSLVTRQCLKELEILQLLPPGSVATMPAAAGKAKKSQ
jgi:small-conductance mechanosensitive channel